MILPEESSSTPISSRQLVKQKFLACLIHLLLSIAVIGLFLLLIKSIWYPDILFELENVWQGLQILIYVDATLGPLLTFVVYSPTKKSLKMDLSVIAILQILAIIYGGYLIHQQRPAVIVFVVDRFEVISAADPVVEDLPNQYFGSREFRYPALSYAIPPQSSQERSDFITSGIRFFKVADRHRPLDEYREVLEKASVDIGLIKPKSKDLESRLNKFKTKLAGRNYVLFPIQGTTGQTMMVALDKSTTEIIDYLRIDPWVNH